jgi:hypothetical protein
LHAQVRGRQKGLELHGPFHFSSDSAAERQRAISLTRDTGPREPPGYVPVPRLSPRMRVERPVQCSGSNPNFNPDRNPDPNPDPLTLTLTLALTLTLTPTLILLQGVSAAKWAGPGLDLYSRKPPPSAADDSALLQDFRTPFVDAAAREEALGRAARDRSREVPPLPPTPHPPPTHPPPHPTLTAILIATLTALRTSSLALNPPPPSPGTQVQATNNLPMQSPRELLAAAALLSPRRPLPQGANVSPRGIRLAAITAAAAEVHAELDQP